jgi:hypothetical protein
LNKNIVPKNVERRIVQSACPTLLEYPNNDEALDSSDVVEEDKADSKGIEPLGVSKALLTELVGAACDVPMR